MGIKLCVCKFRKDLYSRVISNSFAIFYNHEKREIPITNKV